MIVLLPFKGLNQNFEIIIKKLKLEKNIFLEWDLLRK